MKLNDLKKAGAKAQQDLRLAEAKTAELKRKAKAAKAMAAQVWLEYKRVRKAAKQAKRLASEAEEQVRDQLRACEKTQKRLVKAIKKLGKAKSGASKKGTKAAKTAVAPPNLGSPKLAASKHPPVDSRQAAPAAEAGNPASPTT